MKKYFLQIIILGIILSWVSLSLAEEALDPQLLIPPKGNFVSEEEGLILSPGGKGKTLLYTSSLDQNGLEQHYGVLLKGQGFRYRQDKEIRRNLARRLRFDKGDWVVDINFKSKREFGTYVLIMQYKSQDNPIDFKEFISFDGPPLILPKYETEGTSKVIPFRALPPGAGVYTDENLNFQVPPPPQSKASNIPLDKATLEILGNPTDAVAYRSERDPKEVESYYQSFFRRERFQARFDKDFKILGFRRLAFQREDLDVDIILRPMDNGSEVVIFKYSDSEGGSVIEKDPFSLASLPQEDRPGEDLKGIPRPPKSVRWQSNISSDKGSITYIAPFAPAQLRDFYLERMDRLGWKLAWDTAAQASVDKYKEASGNKNPIPTYGLANIVDFKQLLHDTYILDFKGSNREEVRIKIYPNFVEKNSGSMVNIRYIVLQKENR